MTQTINITGGGRGATIRIGGNTGKLPTYTGPTTVIPEIDNLQILQTERKSVMENIMVMPIPITETHNEHGGLTVVIG